MKLTHALVLSGIALIVVIARGIGGVAPHDTGKSVAPRRPEVPGEFEVKPLSVKEFEKLQEELRKQIEEELRKNLEKIQKKDPPTPSETVGDVSLSAPTVSGDCSTGVCYPAAYRAQPQVQTSTRRFRLRFWRR